MKGEIEIKDNNERGSIFTIKIPLQIPQQKLQDFSSYLLPKKMNIIFAMQKENMHLKLQKILNELEYNVLYTTIDAESLLEASNKLIIQGIDLILIDNKIEPFDLLKLIASVKKLEKETSKIVPIYLLANDSVEVERIKLIYSQITGAISRMINESQFLQFIQDVHMKSNRSKVLIVDDEQYNLKTVQLFADQLLIPNLIAQDGDEAVQIYQSNYKEISVILMDNEMVRLSGIEATKQIRLFESQLNQTTKKNYKAQIIILSGNDGQNFVREAKNAGANGYIVKPLNIVAFKRIFYRV